MEAGYLPGGVCTVSSSFDLAGLCDFYTMGTDCWCDEMKLFEIIRVWREQKEMLNH